jgi:hypothetical protein
LKSKGFCAGTIFDTIKHFVISPESYTTDTAPSCCCWALLFRGNLNLEARSRKMAADIGDDPFLLLPDYLLSHMLSFLQDDDPLHPVARLVEARQQPELELLRL